METTRSPEESNPKKVLAMAAMPVEKLVELRIAERNAVHNGHLRRVLPPFSVFASQNR